MDVVYLDEIPSLNCNQIDDQDYMLKLINKRFATKHMDWKYEDEMRIIVDQFAKNTLKIPSDIYKEIIFGHKMSDTDVKEIKIICSKLYPNIEFYSSVPNPKDFGMSIEEIHN